MAVAVGDQPGVGLTSRHGPGITGEPLDRRSHVRGVEGTGHLQRHDARLCRGFGREGGELLEGAGGDDLATTVAVGGGEAVALERGQHLVGVTAENGAHPRGCGLAGSGHLQTALADEHERLFGTDDRGAGSGGDLADRVSGSNGHLGESGSRPREELKQGGQARGDDERLSDGGVPDRVRVGLGAMLEQVDAGDGREPGHPIAVGLQLEPRGEQAGGLGALSRADDCEHDSSVSRGRDRLVT